MGGLEAFVAAYGMGALVGAAAGMALGGFAKGVVGFALPLIGLSVAGSFLPYDVAVALLIVPTLVSNLVQATRNGFGAALGSLRDFWWLNLVLVVVIAFSAQLVVALPGALLFGLLGTAICLFGAIQLAGWRLRFRPEHRFRVETAVAVIGGFFGGISGIWGPPIVMYLLSAGIGKTEMVRVQSISYLLGSVVLLVAHLRSGVLDPVTLPVSAWITLPAMLAMLAGFWVHDRLDQARFTRVTLVVLLLNGLNLLRRAFF